MGAVIFRRIGGHVVPIKLNQEQRQRTRGAAEAAAGAGLAVGAGEVSARLSKRAERLEDMAYKAEHKASQAWGGIQNAGRQMNFFAKRQTERAHRYMRFSDKLMEHANKVTATSKNVRRFGTVGAAGLVGVGVERALRDKTKDNPEARAAISGASGAAAGFIVHNTFRNRAARNLGKRATAARMLKDAGKALAKFAIKKRI